MNSFVRFSGYLTHGPMSVLLFLVRTVHDSGRASVVTNHIDLCTTLFPDEETCAIWAEVMASSRAAGRVMTAADAWVAAASRQFDLPLVTADYRDFDHLDGITLVPVDA